MKLDNLFTSKVVYSEPKRIVEPLAWVGHIPFALWIIENIKPNILVELGTHTGNSYFSFCQAIQLNNLPTHCYAIDTWRGDEHAGYYGDDVHHSVKQFNDIHYSSFSHLLRMTFDEAASLFRDGSIDFLHIDGLHSYDAVRNDFDTWLPKMSDQAVVLFHDINVHERDFGVWRLWEELSATYPHINFDHSNGLGVLFVGKEQPLFVHELLKGWDTSEGQSIIRQFFTRLGQCVEFEWQNISLKHIVADRDRQIKALTESYSWRITAPLRNVMSVFFPQNSLRRLIATLLISMLIRPKVFLQSLTLANIKVFFHYLCHAEPDALAKMVNNVMSRKDSDQSQIHRNAHLLRIALQGETGTGHIQRVEPLDIIVPVYNAYDVTASCIASVLAHSSHCRLIIIDDASTDDRIGVLLDGLQAVPERDIEVIILRNEKNVGFVQSVNRASEQTKHHFVILNSDTEVPPGWLDRLFAPIFAEPDLIASVTPFSNAGMACSFPLPNKENSIYGGLSVTALDSFFRRYGSDEPIELLTGVGFCMAFNRLVVQNIGMFDAETFGKGYGEECDWSLRAVDAGFRNVMAAAMFVYHKHGGSFAKKEKMQLLAMNQERLWAKHPQHLFRQVSIEAVNDQQDIREAVAALVDLSTAARRIAIFDVDMVGGGTLYSGNLADHLQTLGYGVIQFKYNFQSLFLSVTIRTGNGSQVLYLASLATECISALLKLFAVDHLILNELFSWPKPGDVAEQIRLSGISYQVFMHDFFLLCPSWFLIDKAGNFCHLPDDKALCRACLPKNNFSGHRYAYADTLNDRAQWCSVVATFLSGARQIICFSSSTKDYLLKVYPQLLHATVSEHCIPEHELFIWKQRRFDGTGPLRVGIIGNLDYIKGHRVVQELSEHPEFQQMPVTLSIFGDALLFPEGYKTKDGKVSVHGRYRRENLSQLLEKEGIHIALIASILPETFSYTTSEAMLMGYPIICFDLGAPAERVKRYGAGRVVSDISANGIIGVLQAILDTPSLVAEMSEKTRKYVPITEKEHFRSIIQMFTFSGMNQRRCNRI